MSTDTDLLRFERRFALPPDRLWHLLTDARMRAQWGAPSEGQTLTLTQEDFRVGGLERHRCGPDAAEPFEVATRWYRIDAPVDAVFTETVEVEGMPIGTSLVTYKLRDDGPETVLHVAVGLSSFVGAKAVGEFEQGWMAGLDNLESLAKSAA